MTVHPLYLCHQTQCINYTTATLWRTSHALYVWHHIQYAWPNMKPLDTTPPYVRYHTHYIYDIISNIYDITHTAFMTTQCLYQTFPPLYLTSQPLYLCRHTRCINDITTSMEVITLGIRMTSYTFYMKSHWQFMISMLSIYDITSTVLISHQLYLWYLICYIWWHHIHCIQQHIH